MNNETTDIFERQEMLVPAEKAYTLLLIELVDDIAEEINDGHLTILKFLEHYCASFQMPTNSRDLELMPDGETLSEALEQLIMDQFNLRDREELENFVVNELESRNIISKEH